MKFIADTHAFIWFVTDSPQLGAPAKKLFESSENECLFSIASVWEIAVKTSLGKLSFEKPLEQYLPEQMVANSIRVLDISLAHALRVANLPFHHRDPFDRMIIAQSLTENLPILSSDQVFDTYGIKRIW
jgi:PIN domain nuclease of toxin-antitoxin system